MNCKPGDLAFVIRGLKINSPHAGKIVSIIEAGRIHPALGQLWVIEFSRPIESVAVKGDLTVLHTFFPDFRCHCPDAWLRPIRPDTADIDTADANIATQPLRELEPA
jgi:hypothetical protein